MSNVITPEHPRARFIECMVDGQNVQKVACIDINQKEITVVADGVDGGRITYTDLQGNSTEVVAGANTLDCTFKPRKFKAYDSETNEVFAEWDTYPSHDWNHGEGEGDTCLKCGDKDYMADPFCSESKLPLKGTNQ
ncbi:hypothetical protein SIPHO067v1_p0067 [Vibrio phage 51E28.1]|nr:hypothetical protein SIPHO068v1_p0032 [Vibrio phage 51E28.4]QZI92907.1 hypothetical protein SIPHO067v1_p0067 [Vibrio phage 51E28.1]